jgi:16S rRNA (uracil1498-N3)-methyltransferase
MRKYHFIFRNLEIDYKNLQVGQIFNIEESQEKGILYQLKTVLRARPGEAVQFQNIVFTDEDRKTFLISTFIKEINKNNLRCEITNIEQKNSEQNKIGIAICLPKNKEKLDFIVQKSVELGVDKIDLIQSEYSQFKHQLNLERLEKIVLEAVEQSERLSVPRIYYYKNLTALIASEKRPIFVAMERKKGIHSLKEIKARILTVLIGPEGGFSQTEIKLLDQNKINQFTLGDNILRNETAAIVCLGHFLIN